MRRRGMRKGFVQRNEHFWSAVIENDQQIGSNVIRFTPIVAPTDWVVRAGQSTATLVRIRGHVDVGLGSNALAGGANIAYAVIVVDADDAANFSPYTLISYTNHDVLWTRVKSLVQFGPADTAPIAQVSDNFALDIKVRRKLKPDDNVYLVTGCFVTSQTADEDVRLSCIIRGLIVVK